MKVTLIVGGGGDVYYELGLLSGLLSKGIEVDFIGSDSTKDFDIMKNTNVHFYNLRGDQNPNVGIIKKTLRVFLFYIKLIKYAYKTDSKLFHIQWFNKLIYFDRTFLNTFYKLLGKKLVFTAHNVNAGERDENDTLMNRITLKFLYNTVDHIIAHTDSMKNQLIKEFNAKDGKVSVISYGINNMVHQTSITRENAREKLSLNFNQKILLFFGYIAPYKGLKYLVLALSHLKKIDTDIRLIIAGRINKDAQAYWLDIQRIIKEYQLSNYVIEKTEFIPDKEIELYFKSADLLILPYIHIFQSGPLFMAYNFGLPVVATDVGSFRNDIIAGKTGLICHPEDPEDLADKIIAFFNSDFYKNTESNRKNIIDYANEKYSWIRIADKTCSVYKNIM